MHRRPFLSALLGAPLLGRAAPAPPMPPAGGVVVLDDSDEQYQGKATYDDGLAFLNAAGTLTKRVTGLNVCQEIGSPHRVAVDPSRKQAWVAETVGSRLLRFGLDGKELSAINGDRPGAIAIDPKTGNAWVVGGSARIGAGHVTVYGPKGDRLARHDVPGYDIAYDAKSHAFWTVGNELIKLSPAGKVLVRQKVADWAAVTIGVDPKAGTVWVGERQYDATKGLDALKAFDGDGKPLRSVPLSGTPMRLAVDPRDSSVWVTQGRGVVRYSPDLKEKHEVRVEALTLDVETRTGNVWVVTPDDLRKLDRKGKELSRTKHKARTSQAWIAAY